MIPHDEIDRLTKLFDDEYREEHGRLIRLLIGFSAGAITIVCTILADPTKETSNFVIGSLFIHLFSMGFGLWAQWLLVDKPKQYLKKIRGAVDNDTMIPLLTQKGRMKDQDDDKQCDSIAAGVQIVTFVIASILLIVHFLILAP